MVVMNIIDIHCQIVNNEIHIITFYLFYNLYNNYYNNQIIK